MRHLQAASRLYIFGMSETRHWRVGKSFLSGSGSGQNCALKVRKCPGHFFELLVQIMLMREVVTATPPGGRQISQLDDPIVIEWKKYVTAT